VHTLLSLQLRAGPPTQVPAAQVSAVVQAFPSLQVAVLFVCAQPVAGLHESSVHGLPSLQIGGGPPRQVPPLQVSDVVHAFPSLHGAVLFVCAQPVAGLQESSVHELPSSQFRAGPPTQVPPPHVSAVVQAFPSLHAAVLFACVQPVPGMHESSVHGLPSSQLKPPLPAHTPPAQTSPVVQALPSSQGAVLFVWTQPVAGLQVSSVHGLLSLQPSAGPPTHTPPLQVSAVVHAFPSLQGAVLFV
jgi:hypothetical protein